MIRFATPSDAHSIAVIHVVGWQHAYRGQLPDEFLDGLSVAAREAMWINLLRASPNAIQVLAFTEQSVEGFVHYGASRDQDAIPQVDGEVYAIYLHPEAIGHGNGRALMQRAEDALRGAGYQSAVVWVLESNLRARAFYEKMGFAADGTSKNVEIGSSTCLDMRYRKRVG